MLTIGEYKPGKTTFYELNDNLGNVRAVIGAPFTETLTATMESNGSTPANEDKVFKNIAPRSVFSKANHTQPGGDEVIFLNNARPVGPATILTVSPGDVITIDTDALYEGGSGYNTTTASAVILSAITSAFGGVNGAPGDPGKIFTALNNALAGGGFAGLAGSGNDGVPAAYLNMIMFDGNMIADPVNLPMSAIPVTNAANNNQQKITIGPITIPAPGYIYVYVNNNSNSVNRVYFDDLTITHLHSPFVAGGDYYPYGLAMEDRQIKAEPYRFGFQGQFSEEDSVTGWNDFDLRMYDARFGRWMNPDIKGQHDSPYLAMGNSPFDRIDPDGAADFVNSDGLIIGTDGVNDGKTYLVWKKKDIEIIKRGNLTKYNKLSKHRALLPNYKQRQDFYTTVLEANNDQSREHASFFIHIKNGGLRFVKNRPGKTYVQGANTSDIDVPVPQNSNDLIGGDMTQGVAGIEFLAHSHNVRSRNVRFENTPSSHDYAFRVRATTTFVFNTRMNTVYVMGSRAIAMAFNVFFNAFTSPVRVPRFVPTKPAGL